MDHSLTISFTSNRKRKCLEYVSLASNYRTITVLDLSKHLCSIIDVVLTALDTFTQVSSHSNCKPFESWLFVITFTWYFWAIICCFPFDILVILWCFMTGWFSKHGFWGYPQDSSRWNIRKRFTTRSGLTKRGIFEL